MSIGGSTIAQIQVKSGTVTTAIGEKVTAWKTLNTISGWLDLSAGESRYSTYDTKIQESTHVFISDWVMLDAEAENCRMIINNKLYDVLLIDNPMEMNRQLEIYLRYVGGQSITVLRLQMRQKLLLLSSP